MLSNLSIRSNNRIPWWPAMFWLAAGLTVGLGPEVAKLPAWSNALSPAFVGANLNVIGAALITWGAAFVGYKPGGGTGYKPEP